jgi:hypothetical protein
MQVPQTGKRRLPGSYKGTAISAKPVDGHRKTDPAAIGNKRKIERHRVTAF